MDMSLTVAIPITGLILLGNLGVNVARLVNAKRNGIEKKLLEDVRDGQKECLVCFSRLQENSTKSEVHLANIVTQLQTLNNNWRQTK